MPEITAKDHSIGMGRLARTYQTGHKSGRFASHGHVMARFPETALRKSTFPQEYMSGF